MRARVVDPLRWAGLELGWTSVESYWRDILGLLDTSRPRDVIGLEAHCARYKDDCWLLDGGWNLAHGTVIAKLLNVDLGYLVND